MRKRRFWLVFAAAAIALAGTVTLLLFYYQDVLALNFYYFDTDIEDFNEGFFYHTGLALREDGEVQLLPVGLGQPWAPGEPLPEPRGGAATAYYNDYIYVLGGDTALSETWNDVFYTRINTGTYTITGRIEPWGTTTPLPDGIYPDGVYRHEAAALNGYIYSFGGKEDVTPGGFVFDDVLFAEIQPDGTLGSWQQTAPLPQALFGLESVILNGRIYALGGAGSAGISRRQVYFAEPDPVNGTISAWHTTEPLPEPGIGGYYDSAVTALVSGQYPDRIYVIGGSSGLIAPTYSPYVFFSEPSTTTGEITDWTFIGDQPLPFNCFSSEGASYDSGLLLAIAGAWNNATDPSGDVRVTLVELETGWTGEWFSTIAMDPARFLHSTVQDAAGWLYSIGGATGGNPFAPRLDEVQIAAPYSGRGGGAVQNIEQLYATEVETPTIYAATGDYSSRQRAIGFGEDPADLKNLTWETTITDSSIMTISLYYRYHEESGWTDWDGPYNSNSGNHVTTSIPLTGTADSFQYRAYFTSTAWHPTLTTVVTQTPLLHYVRIGILAPPDLQAQDLTVSGCGTCPGLIPPGQPVQIEFTVQNKSTGLKWDNNFYAMAFITTTPGFEPQPPDVPMGCANYPTVTCPLIWPLQGYDFPEGHDPIVLTTEWTFDNPGVYYIVAYIDYNDTPARPHPYHDVTEFNEFNNMLTFAVNVGYKNIFLPIIYKDW
jgi:hypothetical protein